jgi:hypothetical protein
MDSTAARMHQRKHQNYRGTQNSTKDSSLLIKHTFLAFFQILINAGADVNETDAFGMSNEIDNTAICASLPFVLFVVCLSMSASVFVCLNFSL